MSDARPFFDDPVDDIYPGPDAISREEIRRAFNAPRARPTPPVDMPKRPSKKTRAAAELLGAPIKQETRQMITIDDWRPVQKNTLRGFAKVSFPFGLVINDIAIHRKGDHCWASMPAKPQMEPDGTPRRQPDGKLAYTPILSWSSRDLGDRFSATVVRLIEERWPGSTAE